MRRTETGKRRGWEVDRKEKGKRQEEMRVERGEAKGLEIRHKLMSRTKKRRSSKRMADKKKIDCAILQILGIKLIFHPTHHPYLQAACSVGPQTQCNYCACVSRDSEEIVDVWAPEYAAYAATAIAGGTFLMCAAFEY